MDLRTFNQLDSATVYVSTVRHHQEALDHGVTGTVLALDEVGVLLRLVSGAGETWIDSDAERVRFIPWTSIGYLSVQE